MPVITRIINAAYEKEVIGKEAFRRGPHTVSESLISSLVQTSSSGSESEAQEAYQWVLLEVPCGMNIETDGTVLGVCCFTTDGVCRKNGKGEEE